MSINTNQILTQAISMHNEEKYEEAEKNYKKAHHKIYTANT